MAKILIVEDDLALVDVMTDWLQADKHVVEHIGDGAEAIDWLKQLHFDLIILDLDLPGKDGIQICQEFRQSGGSARILMLTGRNTVEARATGLDSGADDYLVKPFHSMELMARVRALMRRNPERLPEALKIGNLELDSRNLNAIKNGKTIQLAPKEFAVLELLMRYPNQTFSPEALIERLWSSETDASPGSVRVCINRLRSKLKEADETAPTVKNVFGVGYMLETELPSNS